MKMKMIFASPQHPFNVDNNRSFKMGQMCQWRILATPGEKIVINITDLDIPKSLGCQSDFLEIRDGYWHKSNLLVRLCGQKPYDKIITSTGNRMLLTYQTSKINAKQLGFIASYEAVCGGDLVKDSGHIESPNYPDDYRKNKECIWKITVPTGFQVALQFQDFEIEKHDSCTYDFIEIRNGNSSESDLIGRFCGYRMPEDIKSSSNHMWIKFVSDASVQKSGFSASFFKEVDECKLMSNEDGCEHECVNNLGGYECKCKIGFELHSDGKRCENACGGFIEASNGTITSPSFPEIYPANKRCTWEIIASPQWRITLNFTHFAIEGNNQDCEYDSVTLTSILGSREIERHGVFCGSQLPQSVTSKGNSLRIEFISDNSVQKTGFAAFFFTDKDECASKNGGCQHICRNTIGSYKCFCRQGYVLHENSHDCKEGGCQQTINTTSGVIRSPDFPENYPSKNHCIWKFSVTPGHRIKLMFTDFVVEPHQECAYDHVVIYDGLDANGSSILGRFCGNKVPPIIVSSQDSMLMEFTSDASVERKGFRALHGTVCGGYLSAEAGIVASLFSHANYGDTNYENNEDCDWIILAPEGQHVRLSFDSFELEDETDICGYDFVEVFSGYEDSAKSHGVFCGNEIPAPIISEEDVLLLRFKSDDTLNAKGFNARFETVLESTEEKERILN